MFGEQNLIKEFSNVEEADLQDLFNSLVGHIIDLGNRIDHLEDQIRNVEGQIAP